MDGKEKLSSSLLFMIKFLVARLWYTMSRGAELGSRVRVFYQIYIEETIRTLYS